MNTEHLGPLLAAYKGGSDELEGLLKKGPYWTDEEWDRIRELMPEQSKSMVRFRFAERPPMLPGDEIPLRGEGGCNVLKFKVGDKVQTRDGRKARIICDDKLSGSPLVVLVGSPTGDAEGHYSYDADGTGQGDSWDLIRAPETRTVWLRWWGNDAVEVGDSKFSSSVHVRACIKVEIPRGRFDE